MSSEFDPERLMSKVFPQSCRITKSGDGGCITHTCLLCDLSDIQCYEWEAHVETSTHRARRQEWQCAQSFWSRRNHVQVLKPRIASLGLEKWRDSVSAKLLDFVTQGHDNSHEQATVALHKYEMLERVSLLELAVWKTACQMSTPSIGLTDPLDFFLWLASGWKQNKTDLRHSRMIAVVMSNVVPFLKPPYVLSFVVFKRRLQIDHFSPKLAILFRSFQHVGQSRWLQIAADGTMLGVMVSLSNSTIRSFVYMLFGRDFQYTDFMSTKTACRRPPRMMLSREASRRLQGYLGPGISKGLSYCKLLLSLSLARKCLSLSTIRIISPRFARSPLVCTTIQGDAVSRWAAASSQAQVGASGMDRARGIIDNAAAGCHRGRSRGAVGRRHTVHLFDRRSRLHDCLGATIQKDIVTGRTTIASRQTNRHTLAMGRTLVAATVRFGLVVVVVAASIAQMRSRFETTEQTVLEGIRRNHTHR